MGSGSSKWVPVVDPNSGPLLWVPVPRAEHETRVLHFGASHVQFACPASISSLHGSVAVPQLVLFSFYCSLSYWGVIKTRSYAQLVLEPILMCRMPSIAGSPCGRP